MKSHKITQISSLRHWEKKKNSVRDRKVLLGKSNGFEDKGNMV